MLRIGELEKSKDDLHALTLGTMTAFQAGGRLWKTWNQWMKETLLEGQHKDGSWPAAQGHTQLLTTVANTLCFEVYYRYDRIR